MLPHVVHTASAQHGTACIVDSSSSNNNSSMSRSSSSREGASQSARQLDLMLSPLDTEPPLVILAHKHTRSLSLFLSLEDESESAASACVRHAKGRACKLTVLSPSHVSLSLPQPLLLTWHAAAHLFSLWRSCLAPSPFPFSRTASTELLSRSHERSSSTNIPCIPCRTCLLFYQKYSRCGHLSRCLLHSR